MSELLQNAPEVSPVAGLPALADDDHLADVIKRFGPHFMTYMATAPEENGT